MENLTGDDGGPQAAFNAVVGGLDLRTPQKKRQPPPVVRMTDALDQPSLASSLKNTVTQLDVEACPSSALTRFSSRSMISCCQRMVATNSADENFNSASPINFIASVPP